MSRSRMDAAQAHPAPGALAAVIAVIIRRTGGCGSRTGASRWKKDRGRELA